MSAIRRLERQPPEQTLGSSPPSGAPRGLTSFFDLGFSFGDSNSPAGGGRAPGRATQAPGTAPPVCHSGPSSCCLGQLLDYQTSLWNPCVNIFPSDAQHCGRLGRKWRAGRRVAPPSHQGGASSCLPLFSLLHNFCLLYLLSFPTSSWVLFVPFPFSPLPFSFLPPLFFPCSPSSPLSQEDPSSVTYRLRDSCQCTSFQMLPVSLVTPKGSFLVFCCLPLFSWFAHLSVLFSKPLLLPRPPSASLGLWFARMVLAAQYSHIPTRTEAGSWSVS